ncbi:ATP-binding protein [Streptomyces sp. ODS28]|uniref:ATP-binding protein n=1 Tax=Streptomyces sp. ODS28 TaxID=3136688 RepID=UPI0031E5E5F9
MKQGTKKSLGVAALGAAFVAAGTGVASADTAETVGTLADTTAGAVEGAPVESLAEGLPTGSPELAGEAQDLTAGAARDLPDTTDRLLDEKDSALGGEQQKPGPAKKLLGGLPVAGDAGSLAGGAADELGGGALKDAPGAVNPLG